MPKLKLTQLIAFICAALAAVGIGVMLVKAQPKEVEVIVPNKVIPAYQRIDAKTDFRVVKVRENVIKEMAEHEATVEWANEFAQSSEDGLLFTTRTLYPNERVDRRLFRNTVRGSLALVNKLTERPISVSINSSGNGAGSIHAGDVVTVIPGNAAAAASGGEAVGQLEHVKLLAVGPSTDAISGEGNAGAAMTAIIAVDQETAKWLVGQSVSLILEPFCEIDDNGDVVPVKRKGAEDADCGDDKGDIAVAGGEASEEDDNADAEGDDTN